MSDKPIVPVYTERIDYDGITKRFEAIKEQAKKASTITEFVAVACGPYEETVKQYYHLASDENYRPGELASMLSHCIDCINAIVPEHLLHVCVMAPSGDGLLFLPKEAVKTTPSSLIN